MTKNGDIYGNEPPARNTWVAGGSGAFTTMLCRQNPGLDATILEFPMALPVAGRLTGDTSLAIASA